jgi:hypothetical protein
MFVDHLTCGTPREWLSDTCFHLKDIAKSQDPPQGFTPDEVKARYFAALPATLEINRMPEAWPN